MNLLVTGSTGFVGSYIIRNNSNHKIQTFSFLRDDLNELDIDDVDTVLHLSALVHQMGGASESEYMRINVDQTVELAKKAKKAEVKHFICMSSVKVYGEENNRPYTEDSKCMPSDPYGKSKLIAERELLKIDSEEFVVSIIRTPIVYGEGVKANILNLVKLVNKMKVLPFGGINNKRSMVYLGNLKEFVDRIIEKRISGIFLVSDEEPISTSRLIKVISDKLNKSTYNLKIPLFGTCLRLLRPNLFRRLFMDLYVNNSKTLNRLDIRPKYSTDEGIAQMVKNIK